MQRSVLLGPLPDLPDGVVFSDDGDRLRLTATRDLCGIAGPTYADPEIAVRFPLATVAEPGSELLGFAFTQFALPVRARLGHPFEFNPTSTLHSPPVVIPLVIGRPDGTFALAAPENGWHEQIIAVDQDDAEMFGLRWGWHGDLDRVPAGFTTTLRIVEGDSAEAVFRRWGDDLRSSTGKVRRGDDNRAVTHLSYWTDNGAAYWYRSEPGQELAATLETKIDELATLGVAVGSVELDSWFYPHEISRPVVEAGYVADVPPTGMLAWEPRADVLPDGVEALRDRLGGRPLILHARHLSPRSPYVDDGEWWIDHAAHPVDPAFFRRWFDDAARWGAVCIEQDWMLLVWFGVRQLREAPGRALAWQRALDQAAAATGIGLLWCMATPGDLMASVELENVIAVRTSDDYRYAADPGFLWHWYLTVNRLADALGLAAFKDCFLTGRLDPNASTETKSINGDPHPETEAVLAAFSAGVVGIGDRLGRTDPELIGRLCRPDGLLIKPDRPLALTDQSLFTSPGDNNRLFWATTESGRWRYLIALHLAPTDALIDDGFELDDEWLVYDWRRGTAGPSRSVRATLAPRDWALFVCCPIESTAQGRRALIGDTTKFVTMGTQRVEAGPESEATVLLADGEEPVALRWWFEDQRPVSDRPG